MKTYKKKGIFGGRYISEKKGSFSLLSNFKSYKAKRANNAKFKKSYGL